MIKGAPVTMTCHGAAPTLIRDAASQCLCARRLAPGACTPSGELRQQRRTCATERALCGKCVCAQRAHSHTLWRSSTHNITMKRALEPDFPSGLKCKILARTTARYTCAMKVAAHFYEHVRALFMHGGMCISGSTYMRLHTPTVHFNWVDADDGTHMLQCDETAAPLQIFLDTLPLMGLHTKGKWDVNEAGKVYCLEQLTEYFATQPQATLELDAWGGAQDGCVQERCQGGRIGQSTGFKWVAAAESELPREAEDAITVSDLQ